MVVTNWLGRLSPRERTSVAIFLSLFILGAGLLVGRSWGGEEIILEEPSRVVAEPEPAQEPEQIYVHVAGNVKKPGVYQLPDSSRVFEAIELAGGVLEGADLDFLNLAQVLTDGSKIYLPAKGEEPEQDKLAGSISETPKRATSAPKSLSGKININTANSTQLQLLPGIGPALAGRILAYREQIGRFDSIEQLLDVSGIGTKVLEKLRAHLQL